MKLPENPRIQRFSENGSTSMDKFYVQLTWLSVPAHSGTDTIEFIFHKYKPRDRKATYVRSVCNVRPQKTDTHRTRLASGRNLIDYPGEISTPTSDLTTMKLHINSAISDVKSRYVCMDEKYFHLNNQMDRD